MSVNLAAVTVPAALIIPCDDRCMFAIHEDCDCECGGKNHQKGHLLTAVQRTPLRTEAGRRIPLISPGTPDWDVAVAMYEAREDGDTNVEIAEAFGVGPAKVRRTVRSYLFTLAVAAQQAAEVAA